MPAQNRLVIDLDLNDKDALAKLRASLGTMEKTSKGATDSMNLGWAGFASQLYVAQAALQPIIGFMKDAVRAAVEQEDATRRLNLAMINQGTFTRVLAKQYDDLAQELAKNSRFTDDAILSVEQRLIAIGNVAPAQMKRVTQATLDLAAQTGDLEGATLAMARAAQGNTTALSRMGITIDEGLDKSKKFDAALGAIETKFKGAASGDIKSFGGQISQLGKAWGEFTEEVGTFVIQDPAVQKALKGAVENLEKMAEGLKKIREQNPENIGRILKEFSIGGLGGAIYAEAGRSDSKGAQQFARNVEQTIVGTITNMAAGPVAATVSKALFGMFQDKVAGGGNSLAKAVLGSPEKNAADAVAATAVVDAAERQALENKRLAEMQAAVTQSNLLIGTEELKLQSVVQGTEIYRQIKEQETLAWIQQENLKIDTLLKNSTLELQVRQRLVQQKAALNQAEKIAVDAGHKAEAAALTEKYKNQVAMAAAVADLSSALATATGSSALKGIAIVLKGCVEAAKAIIAIRAAANPFEAIIAGVQLATIIAASVNAFSALNAAEAALKASRSESVQAVTNVQGLATGTNRVTSGGAFIVGENGPEVVSLPVGSAVTPNGGVGGMTFNITINNPIITTEEATRSVAKDIARYASDYIDTERRRL